MHLMQAIAPDCWGALDFVDGDGQLVERKLTIRDVTQDAPPAGGKKKPCVIFVEDGRKCFFSNKELKFIGALLNKYELSKWRGAVLLVTAGEKKMKGQPVMGMVVKNAAFPKSLAGGAPNVQP